MKYAIGIDIGGTNISAGILNEKGDLIQTEIVSFDPSDKEKMFQQVITCVHQVLDHCSIPLEQIYGMGVGVPGKVDVDKGIAVFQNNLPWTNFPLVERLRETFSIDNIIIDNDVYMATYAEWIEAKLDQDQLFAYITVDTGIASSFIQGGSFIRGAGFAGELGLIPVVSPAEEDDVKRLELVAAGPAIQKQARQRLNDETIMLNDIFESFENGDTAVLPLIDDMVASLAHGIYIITSLLNPHKIVLGGSVVSPNSFLLNRIKDHLEPYLLDEQKHILDNIQISYLGDEQGIIGAGLRVF